VECGSVGVSSAAVRRMLLESTDEMLAMASLVDLPGVGTANSVSLQMRHKR